MDRHDWYMWLLALLALILVIVMSYNDGHGADGQVLPTGVPSISATMGHATPTVTIAAPTLEPAHSYRLYVPVVRGS